ncbi:MAG: sulfatase-like hydrolase/transferase [Planctomycetaceae bacterium]
MKLSRVGFLLLLSLIVSLPMKLTLAAKAKKRPNILFLFADDQNAGTVGAFGNPHVKTPNIDRIVKGGYRFTRAYCMGSMSGAVCIPSRAMLNSGRTLFHVKHNLAGSPLLPEVLGNHGYTTFGTGKWHNGQKSFVRGFQHGKAVFFGGMNDHTKVPLADVTPDDKIINRRVGNKFSNILFADAAIDFLKNHDDEKPFYAYVAFTAPHDPRQAPEEFMKMYEPEKIPVPKNFMPQHPFFNGWMTGRDEALAPWPRTRKIIRHQTAEYYALITHMDSQIGRILKTLKETGQAENTIIVYAADHGLALGRHGLLGKQSVYEHSMNAPLVFYGPGIPQGKTTDAFAYLLDIFPTLCDLTGIKIPDSVEGKSLAGILRGKETGVRDTVYTAYQKVMRSVRDDRWKLIRYTHINKTQLFDLKNDPLELHNLAGNKEQAARVEKMMAQLADWQKKLGDKLPLTTKNPVSEKIDLTGRKRRPDRHQPKWIVRKYFDLEGWDYRD